MRPSPFPNGANIAGQAAAAPYPLLILPVTLTVAGIAAPLLYAGEAPGFSGLLQVDAVVPGGIVSSFPAPPFSCQNPSPLCVDHAAK